MERARWAAGGVKKKREWSHIDKFDFELCLALRDPECPHPDYLLERLTYRQYLDWMDYYLASPWGTKRQEQLVAAQTFFLVGAFCGADDQPSMEYPHFETEQDLIDSAARIDEYVRKHHGG